MFTSCCHTNGIVLNVNADMLVSNRKKCIVIKSILNISTAKQQFTGSTKNYCAANSEAAQNWLSLLSSAH